MLRARHKPNFQCLQILHESLTPSFVEVSLFEGQVNNLNGIAWNFIG
jgi:hypothetical protein